MQRPYQPEASPFFPSADVIVLFSASLYERAKHYVQAVQL
jgi:hypothetical protein